MVDNFVSIVLSSYSNLFLFSFKILILDQTTKQFRLNLKFCTKNMKTL